MCNIEIVQQELIKKLTKKKKRCQYNKTWYLRHKKNFNKIFFELPIEHPHEMRLRYAGFNLDSHDAAKNRNHKENYNIIEKNLNISAEYIRNVKNKDIASANKYKPLGGRANYGQSTNPYQNKFRGKDPEYEFSSDGKHYRKKNDEGHLYYSDLGNLIQKVDSNKLTWKSSTRDNVTNRSLTKYDKNPYFRGA